MKMHKIKLVSAMLWLIPVTQGFSTHNRAGEITYRQLSGFTFEFTITTYTYTKSPADRSQLEVQWGDNTTSIAPRIPPPLILPNDYQKNTYKATHTFPGPGVYEVVVEDPNRNYGVINIPSSVNVVFSIKTILLVNPQVGQNNTPVLLNPPYDKAAVGHLFIHNPAAYDPDGDSLTYSLAICTREGGEPISNYTFPTASDTFYVNEVTGDLVWKNPVKEWQKDGEFDRGIYNVAMNIDEWRNGIKIGTIHRDMQIDVYETENDPPVNGPLNDLCVVAGDFISFEVTATDPNNDMITHWDTGGVYQVSESRPVFTMVSSDSGTVTSRFEWQTTCSHVRRVPYNWLVKAEDVNEDISLADIDNVNIRVIGPPTGPLEAIPSHRSILLKWSPCACDNVVGYDVYRRIGSTDYTPDSCEYGVPSYLGYQKIGSTSSWQDTVFIDDNNGNGLLQGTDYCYLVVAVYPDGTPGIASNEACGILVQGTPVITNVSVTDTDPAAGSIYLAWVKPRDLDTIPAYGPYEYRIYRAEGIWGTDFDQIHSFTTVDLEDTTYNDLNINTQDVAYHYRVELYNDEPGNRFMIGEPGTASSLFLQMVPGDNKMKIFFRKNVPWLNTRYVVYRQNHSTLLFDSIGVVSDSVYVDSGLANGVNYCYLAKSIGTYNQPGIPDSLINFSHENCGTPVDLEPPCPPELTVYSVCDSFYNVLRWAIPEGECGEDIVKYNLFYTPLYNGTLQPIGTVDDRATTVFHHFPEETMAGCYAMTAVDSFGNESALSARICIDECSYFELPNVFSPNNDGDNDFFRPKAYRFVKAVDIQIFNRWGELVFEESYDDPSEFIWNGQIKNTGKIVSPGVYYYICDVTEQRLTGEEVRNMVGFVYVFTEKNPPIHVEK